MLRKSLHLLLAGSGATLRPHPPIWPRKIPSCVTLAMISAAASTLALHGLAGRVQATVVALMARWAALKNNLAADRQPLAAVPTLEGARGGAVAAVVRNAIKLDRAGCGVCKVEDVCHVRVPSWWSVAPFRYAQNTATRAVCNTYFAWGANYFSALVMPTYAAASGWRSRRGHAGSLARFMLHLDIWNLGSVMSSPLRWWP